MNRKCPEGNSSGISLVGPFPACRESYREVAAGVTLHNSGSDGSDILVGSITLAFLKAFRRK